MDRRCVVATLACLGWAVAGATVGASAGGAQSAQREKGAVEAVREMERGCTATAAQREARNAQSTFFERLGGQDRIHALAREIVRLHRQNPEIGHYFANSDPGLAARRAAEFIISGTGGPAVYEGPDLRTTHAHMRLSNRDFVAAGRDIVKAMTTLGYGPNEVDDLVCTLVSLRDQVVREDQVALGGR